MNDFLKNIIRIMTFIISLLLIYLIVLAVVMSRKSKDDSLHREDVLGGATVTDATLSDASLMDATAADATMTDATETDANENFASALDADLDDDELDGVDEEKELPSSASIEMELILQHPELPTGCETVALTMLLKFYGFDLDKTTIAKDYLIYSNNFVEGYMGNPFTTGGAGIYSPGLTRTANKYLDAQDSELNAKNVTDSTPEELYRYIANGTPVVIWNTVYFLQNQPTGLTVKWGEKTYVWDNCEHCMVLSGYDLERNVVIVHDPIEGVVERDAEGFWQRYENLGSMALIIR